MPGGIQMSLSFLCHWSWGCAFQDFTPVYNQKSLNGFAFFSDFISVFPQAAPTCKAEPGNADSVCTGIWRKDSKL